MSKRRAQLQHAGAALTWPVGTALASWRYVWRTTPVYRRDETVGRVTQPPELPGHLVDDRVCTPADGVGPVINRRYRTEICASEMTAEELVDHIIEDPNRMAPREVAYFLKTSGPRGRMQLGEEYLILMPGPWNGPIRVVDCTPCSFRFTTLEGHLEAGQIEFRVRPKEEHLVFEIESWASSGDRLSAFLYERLRMSKEVQLNLWTHFLNRVVRTTRGRMAGGIHVETYREDAR